MAVEPVERGNISQRLVISGELQAASSFILAPRVSGRLLDLNYHIGDRINQGALVAQIDETPFRADLAHAKAERMVAEARLSAATSALTSTQQRAERITKLTERGVSSEAEREQAEGELRAAKAAIIIAEATLEAAKTEEAQAEIALSDCSVYANWEGDTTTRVIGERFVDGGTLVNSGQALLSVLDISSLTAVVYVDEKTYSQLHIGQQAHLSCDAYPAEKFIASVARIAPRFAPDSRQARVELTVPNQDQRLKPGMFVRAELILKTVEDATLVPVAALANRLDSVVVYVVDDNTNTVREVPIRIGLRDHGEVQVIGDNISGNVVVLGHQLIGDGSAITIPGKATSAIGAKNPTDRSAAAAQ